MRSAVPAPASGPTPTGPPSCPGRATTPRCAIGPSPSWPEPSAIAWPRCSGPVAHDEGGGVDGEAGPSQGPYIIRRTMARRYLFTSESVTEGHPDKLADQISDAVLDAVLTDDPLGRVACETLVTTGVVFVAGEITTSTYVEIPKVGRDTVKRIGYTDAKFGIDGETCGVIV